MAAIKLESERENISRAASGMPWRLVAFSAIGYFVDLFDTFLVPSVRIQSFRDLGVPDLHSLSAYTTVLNWQLAGQVLGALLLWGPAADLRGRRKVLIGSILLYSLANIATALVTSTSSYALIRFVAGIGLGGELGAAITMVAEALPSKAQGRLRSIATMIVGFGGMLGVVTAAALTNLGASWRSLFVVGGVLGLGIMALRFGVHESDLFKDSRQEQRTWTNTSMDLLRWPNPAKYIACILVGAPSFLVCGLLVPGAPEFAKAIGMVSSPSPTKALIWTYLSIACGDILCGYLSSLVNSRKIALLIFHVITAGAVFSFYIVPPADVGSFYVRCAIVGIGLGYWGNMVANAAEQFPTKTRATATISVPNWVRFLLLPISEAVWSLSSRVGFKMSTFIVAACCSSVAIAATLSLKDGAKIDLRSPS